MPAVVQDRCSVLPLLQQGPGGRRDAWGARLEAGWHHTQLLPGAARDASGCQCVVGLILEGCAHEASLGTVDSEPPPALSCQWPLLRRHQLRVAATAPANPASRLESVTISFGGGGTRAAPVQFGPPLHTLPVSGSHSYSLASASGRVRVFWRRRMQRMLPSRVEGARSRQEMTTSFRCDLAA
jgi:hypothetical protein